MFSINKIKKVDSDNKLKFPGKNYFGDNFSVTFIKKRMAALDEFLKEVISNPAYVKM